MQKKLLILAVVILVLAGGVMLQKKQFSQNVEPINNEAGEAIFEANKYENSIIGLAFYYPKDWEVNEGEFTHGRGDGANTFVINLFPLNWNSLEQSNIGISHYPSKSQSGESYDNLPIDRQLALIDCSTSYAEGAYEPGYACEVRKNKNGVVYVWAYGYIDQKFKGYATHVMVPTGKYIISFSIYKENEESSFKDLETFETVVESIELR